VANTPILRRQSLGDQVADAILAMIMEEKLSAGDSLPSTGELAERFAVSRTVIREALADLTGRGIIERSQGRESVVSMPGSEQLQVLLNFRVERDDIDVQSIMEFRQSIEVDAARLAATRRSDDQLAGLRVAFDALAKAKGEVEFHDADIAFHRAVAAASGNPLMVLVLDSLVELLQGVRRRSYRGRKKRGIGLDGVVADHKAVLQAILKSDPDAAAKAMSKHLGNTIKDLSAAS
jgi:DNA-binding FadR family transcriptional regulator